MAADNHPHGRASRVSGELPHVDPAFRWTHETWGHALRARPVEPHAQHLFTSSQLELPAAATDDQRRAAWDAVAASLGTTADRVRRVRQVHGRAVRVLSAAEAAGADPAAFPDGDAVVSNVAGLVLTVVVADCVPLLMVDARRGAAAAVHAGWRGTAAGVTGAAVAAMRDTWGTDPADLLVAVGPSIGPADYEVGGSLRDAFVEAGHGPAVDRWFSHVDGRWHLDLWRANADQLVDAGVAPSRVWVAGASTFAWPGWLESYRRDGPAAGRLVAAIVVPRA